MSLTDQSTRAEECSPAAAILPALPPAQRFQRTVDLPMRHAGLRRVHLRIECVGPIDAPAVWVAGGISANRHVLANALDGFDGWWQAAAGRGCALDPYRLRLLSFDWVGADGELDAAIDTADQADAIALALDALGIARLHAFVGASYGGMVGLQFAARHPQRIERLAVLSAADRPHPFASAFRALQRQVVALGQLQCAEALGLSLARQLAMLSYRSPNEFAGRFAAPAALEGGRARSAAEDYLQACGQRYVARWSATAFLRLSESIDLHAVEPSRIRLPTRLLAVEGDWLAPVDQLQALARELGGSAQCQVITSDYGHDAFLKEIAAVDALIRQTLNCCSPETTS